ncbi:DUF4174 domain-containing protein [Paracidobacterium acidisoli]|uniref:DUF4174 domain-containing protein n=1 Tax=Paracidobacterium acidisoli TaxID=2303751 RepID=A0A372ITG1_9BACT|nr:DUF4174 domain-containing protein [Paracidobacterium acidisoli]MBT9329619.1 DUF4174 domain-containing protein [Paracidobacterium acidisoli]
MALRRQLLALTLLFTGTSLWAQARPSCQVIPRSLDAMRGCYRPLLVFSPGAGDPLLKEQTASLDAAADDMMDRFVMLTPLVPDPKAYATPLDTPYALLPAQEIDSIRARYHIPVDKFTVLLLGEDGKEKLRSAKPLPVDQLNALIDSMPERKAEMLRPHAN